MLDYLNPAATAIITHTHSMDSPTVQFSSCHLLRPYLKKSFLQYSLPSREKHFSVKLHLHSQHCTHLTCQALSSTLSRKRSRIGLSQPAQWTMALAGLQTPADEARTHSLSLSHTRTHTHKPNQQPRPSIDRLSAFSLSKSPGAPGSMCAGKSVDQVSPQISPCMRKKAQASKRGGKKIKRKNKQGWMAGAAAAAATTSPFLPL